MSHKFDITKIMGAAAVGSESLTLGEETLIGRSSADRCLVGFRLQLAQTCGTLTLMYSTYVDGVHAFLDDVIQMEATTPNYGERRW